MKLLLYSREFSPSVGGVQTIVAELARGLARSAEPRGDDAVDITLVTETPSSGPKDQQFPFPVIRQPGFWKIATLILRTDIIHLAGPAIVPLALSWLLKKPVVVEHHGFQATCPNGQMLYEPCENTCPGHFMAGNYGECLRCNRKKLGLAGSALLLLLTPVRRWMCSRVRANIMPTHWLASQLGLKRGKVVLHGIESGASPSEENGTVASRSIFAYQGRLVSTKGVRVLLKAFEQLCDEGRSPRLIIIGTGPEEESLKCRTAKYGEKVQFGGAVPSGSLDQMLAAAATVVIPSLAGEVFGLVAAENMLRGKLLIVSDLGSLREVVGDTGLVFATGDTVALADCMRSAMDDASRAGNLGRAARARAERAFGAERMVEEHLAVYREALATKE
ncbi:MAG: glycosyltransferase family 4 protein [Candidatus Acidiferrales bacterium]